MALRTAYPFLLQRNATVPVPPEAVRALSQLGRAVATEKRDGEAELASSTGRSLTSRTFGSLFRGERPVRATTPRGLNPVTAAATDAQPMQSQQERAYDLAQRTTPEKPRYSWVRGSTNPLMAAQNRTLRRRGAALLSRSRFPVLLGGGVNPIDHANGLTTPDRGRQNVNQRSAKPGTPTPVFEAPDELAYVSKSPTPAALGRGTVDGEPEAQAAGGGALNWAFLAGAVFVAWLALK